jgi:hypothetical protein
MYSVRVVTQGRKARLNLTIDPDIYRSSRRVFNALDMNMSGFIEQQLATFLQFAAPLEVLLKQTEGGEIDPGAYKIAMRALTVSATGLVGEQLIEFGRVSSELTKSIEEMDTDKK